MGSIHQNHMVDGLHAALAEEDRRDAENEWIDTFMQDAADNVLCTEGNAAYFVGESAKLETLFLQLLWADQATAFAKVCALRDALRETVCKRAPSDVRKEAERLAEERAEEMREAFAS